MSKSVGVGTKFNLGVQAVGGLNSISGLDLSADTVDVTDLGNSTGYRDFLAGFKDGGELGLSGFLDGADEGQAAMLEAFHSGEQSDCKIIFPSAIGKTWEFKGVVTKFTTGAEVDSAISFEATVKVCGKPELKATVGG